MPIKKPALGGLFRHMADRTGLEPATSGVTGRHSNQLNYRSANVVLLLFSLHENLCATPSAFLVGGTGVEPVTYGL